jgi:hypothetical protein
VELGFATSLRRPRVMKLPCCSQQQGSEKGKGPYPLPMLMPRPLPAERAAKRVKNCSFAFWLQHLRNRSSSIQVAPCMRALALPGDV